MKTFGLLLILLFGVLFMNQSCDRPQIAYQNIPDVDSSFYPGLWSDYLLNELPDFPQNTNTQRNVLIEKFTGHRCGPCTNAAIYVNDLALNNPEHVFYASLHAGGGGMTDFQEFNPTSFSFFTNHTNPLGIAYGLYFGNGNNFDFLPGLMVNKKTFEGEQYSLVLNNNQAALTSRVNNILLSSSPKYNIQAIFNYFPETQGGYLHVEVEKLNNTNPAVDIIVYVVQDSLRDWQKMANGSENPNYLHKNKHLGNIDNLLWGQRLNFSAGNKVRKDYSFAKPVGIEPENIHFLIFISDAETKEVYQVIKKKMLG